MKKDKKVKVRTVAEDTYAEHKAIAMIQELNEQKNDGEAYKSAVIQILDCFGLRIQGPEFRAKVEKKIAEIRKRLGMI